MATASSAWSATFMRQSILMLQDRPQGSMSGKYVLRTSMGPYRAENGTAVDLPLMAKGEGEAAMDAIPDRQPLTMPSGSVP